MRRVFDFTLQSTYLGDLIAVLRFAHQGGGGQQVVQLAKSCHFVQPAPITASLGAQGFCTATNPSTPPTPAAKFVRELFDGTEVVNKRD